LVYGYKFVAAKFKLHYGDMTDSSCLVKIVSLVRPTEIYNLAAQSHVKVSLAVHFKPCFPPNSPLPASATFPS